MITIFNINKNTTELSDTQRGWLLDAIEKYADTPDGCWIDYVPYSSITYKWKADFEGSDIMAARPLTGNSIYLMPNGDNSKIWVDIIAPAAIHELRHIWQRQKYGILIYSLLSVVSKIPGLYMLSPLEKDAFDQQDKAAKYI